SEFEQVIKNYVNMVKFDDNMFNNIKDEAFNNDYISNTENLNDLLQFNSKNLDIKTMFDFNIFLNKKLNKTTNDLKLEDEHNYDINKVINVSKEV
ncbi:14877_t:CDS:1, partial [Cetraspora pellucida]